MRKRAQKPIKYKKERVVLSDILPYEVPPFFTNRYFYNFITSNKVVLCNNEIRFKKDNTGIIDRIIRIIFGLGAEMPCYRDNSNYDYYKLKDKSDLSIPFKFRINHKDNDFRELTVIHPINQLSLVNFYDKYKHTILFYSNISKFSLRKPSKIATLKYYKDSTNKSRRSTSSETEIIETSDKEYTSLKTFFSYSKYSNIYKFYESHEFHRVEKKFDNLLKFDISRCFDSIYTHSLSWATLSKKSVKDNLPKGFVTFGDSFDRLMQKMNYNETNGIIIGPEFSRIFAELILQRIDKTIERELHKKGYRYKEDYDIYRYVDDYFVFYNKDDIKNDILSLYKIKLQEYNLYFNDSKTAHHPKPIITNITIAKEGIKKLSERSVFLILSGSDLIDSSGVKHYTAQDVITNYKLILANTNTSYKDLQNYFLAIIFNKLKSSIKIWSKEQKKLSSFYLKRRNISISNSPEYNEVSEAIQLQEKRLSSYFRQLHNNFKEIIELTFFIYSVLPKVSYSIKVCHIIFRIIDFIKNQEKLKQKHLSEIEGEGAGEQHLCFDFDKKHIIFKNIYDNIVFIFNRNKCSEYAQVETIYMLPILNELGKHYQLSEELLIKHFNVAENSGGSIIANNEINYFVIISILNYIKRDLKYDSLRLIMQGIIKNKFTTFEGNKAEDVFLLIDVLSCPYVASNDAELKQFRKDILEEIKFFEDRMPTAEKERIMDSISREYSNMFFVWVGNDIGKELNTKLGHDVY